MKRLALATSLLVILAGSASTTETALKHAEILSTLTGATVAGPDWTQTFDKGGATTYVAAGKQSVGRWDVQGDQYCSMWPPSDQWSCYAVTAEVVTGETTITWIATDGSREAGHLLTKGQ